MKQSKFKIMSYETIEVGVYYYIDETGKKIYDYDEMGDEFEQRLNELDTDVVVMVSIQ